MCGEVSPLRGDVEVLSLELLSDLWHAAQGEEGKLAVERYIVVRFLGTRAGCLPVSIRFWAVVVAAFDRDLKRNKPSP